MRAFARTRLRRRAPALGTLVVCIALALTACSGGEERALELGSGKGLKIFRYARGNEHKTLDPARQFDQASAILISNIYDTLLDYHYLDRPYRLVPRLLERMPEPQADSTTYLFTLKQNVHFSDDPAFAGGKGRELTVDDVIYSIKRFADARVNVKSYILVRGTIVGLDEFRARTREPDAQLKYERMEIPGIRKLDRYRMTIQFTVENPLALYPFASSVLSIVAWEAVEAYGEDFASHPVGTGPFVLEKLERRGTIVLKRNPHYHGHYPTSGEPGDAAAGLLADAGKRLPLVDEIHLPLIEESQPRMLRFRKGELDWIPIDRDNFRKMAYRDENGSFHLKSPYDRAFRMYTEPGLSTEYIAFNMKDELVGGNLALRQAIAYALNIDEFIKILRNGRALPLETIVPHPIAGSEGDIDVEYYRYDPERAKEKLAEAGYPGGAGLPPITFEYRNTSKDVRQEFEFIRNELSAVGISAKANFNTFAAYLKRIESGNFQLGSSGWAADYPDGENFYQLLYSKNTTPGPNMSEFSNPEYDRLYEESRFMPNGPERFAKFRRMSEIIRDEVPLILRFNALSFGLYQNRIGNLKRNIMLDAPFRFLDLEESSEAAPN
jgi:ABC-type transport system substrate-binding protein